MWKSGRSKKIQSISNSEINEQFSRVKFQWEMAHLSGYATVANKKQNIGIDNKRFFLPSKIDSFLYCVNYRSDIIICF